MYVLGRVGAIGEKGLRRKELPSALVVVMGIATVWPLAVWVKSRKEKREIAEFEAASALPKKGEEDE